MTGGHTHLMKKFVSPKIRIIDEDLVFKGIYFLSTFVTHYIPYRYKLDKPLLYVNFH